MSPRGGRVSPRVVGTAVGVLAPAVAALALWLVGAPRTELVSVGEGRGVLFPESGSAGGAQLLLLLVLLGAAVVCAVLVLWRRHPDLRRPRGLVVLAGVPALTCVAAAAAATPVSDLLLAPDEDTPSGVVLGLPPEVGPLFFGPMVYGESGPSWGALPAGAGWFVAAATVALLTAAALAHFATSDDLGDGPADPDDVGPDDTGPVSAPDPAVGREA